MAFAFLYLQRSLKNTYPTIWQMGFAFLLTWQILGKHLHICKPRDLRRPRACSGAQISFFAK
jgi:hypothetical protein